MPWQIENQNNIVKYLLPSTVYIIGRASADLILNEKSISRKHASLIWENGLNYITIEDFSKFGTFINKIPLTNKQGNIKDGDTVTFGAQPGINLRFSFLPFDLVSSTLFNEHKFFLKQYLSTVGGNLLENWNDKVKFLVMSNLKVTFKVVCALIKQIKIVNVNFVKAMIDYFKGITQNIPDAEDYLPEIYPSEDSFSASYFKSNLKRKILFNNKKFYFMSEVKLLRLSEAVISGGGQAILLTDSDCNDTSLRLKLAHPDCIVMHESVTMNLVNKISAINKKLNKRLISDSEIGFAVMFASIDDYCNPWKPLNKLDDLENNVPKSISTNSIENYIEVSKKENSLIISGKSQSHWQISDFSQKNKKRMHSSLAVVHEQNINVIDLDCEQNIDVIDINQDTNTRNYSKINLLSSKLFNKSGNNFQEMTNNQIINVNQHDKFNEEFDNISIPGFKKLQTEPVNIIMHEPAKTVSKHLQKELKYFDNLSMQPKVNTSSPNQSFDQQLINVIPTKILKIPIEQFDIIKSGENIKFENLVKVNYSKFKNFKHFQKKSSTYFERYPVS